MSVYVDMIRPVSTSRRWTHPEAAHLLADTIEELHAFAASIKLAKCWYSRGSTPHYDVNRTMWEKAIAAGAIQLDRKQTVALIHRLRGEKTIEQALADERLPVHIAQRVDAYECARSTVARNKARGAQGNNVTPVAAKTPRTDTIPIAPDVQRRSKHERLMAALGKAAS